MLHLSRPVLRYVLTVVGVSIGLMVFALTRYPVGRDVAGWALLLAFILLVTLSDRYGLQFTPGAYLHVDTIGLLAAVLLFNPAEALLVAALGRILGRLDRHIPWHERAFNISQTLVYVGVSSLLLHWLTPTPWMPVGLTAWLGLLVVTVTMFGLNTGIVAGIVSLSSRARLLPAWLNMMSGMLLEHGVMAGFGLLTTLVVGRYPWALVLVALPSVAVFIAMNRTLRMETKQKQLAERNAALAADLDKQAGQLRQAYAILEDALDAKDQMVRNVSHELRTPLVAIMGFTEMLLDGICGELSPEVGDNLKIVSRNAEQMTRIVNDLLSLQALDRRQMDFCDVDVSQLLHTCVTALAERIATARVDLRVDCGADLPMLHGDTAWLEQMVAHLLDNAIKFSPNGGPIVLSAQRLAADQVQLAVADHGIGIPEVELSKIFRRFYQVDGATTRRYAGQGLGLAIAKRIVDLHGGLIRVESQVGRGTTFYVTLPIEAPVPQQLAELDVNLD